MKLTKIFIIYFLLYNYFCLWARSPRVRKAIQFEKIKFLENKLKYLSNQIEDFTSSLMQKIESIDNMIDKELNERNQNFIST